MKTDWKFFVIEITYLIPFEQMSEIVPEHRAFLQTGYDQGWILVSGPKLPKTGGIIVTRAPSQEAVESFFANDPFLAHKVATYQFIEFDPVKRQGFIENWVNN